MKKISAWKRLGSLLMALLLTVSLLPVHTFAEGLSLTISYGGADYTLSEDGDGNPITSSTTIGKVKSALLQGKAQGLTLSATAETLHIVLDSDQLPEDEIVGTFLNYSLLICDHDFQDGKCGKCSYDCTHFYMSHQQIVEGTCIDISREKVTCRVCGYSFTNPGVIDPNNHNWDAGVACDHEGKCAVKRTCQWESTHTDVRIVGDHNWVNSVCSVCNHACTHPAWSGNTCTACGFVCDHNGGLDNPCTVCGFTKYQLWIAGTQVTSENASNITGTGITGTVTYDPATKTLDLGSATVENAGGTAVMANEDITVKASGATVKGSNFGIWGKGDVRLSGSFAAITADGNTAVRADGSLNCDAAITALTGRSGLVAEGAVNVTQDIGAIDVTADYPAIKSQSGNVKIAKTVTADELVQAANGTVTIQASGTLSAKGVTGKVDNAGLLCLPTGAKLENVSPYTGAGLVKVGDVYYTYFNDAWYVCRDAAEGILITADTPATYYRAGSGYAIYDGSGKLTLNNAAIAVTKASTPAIRTNIDLTVEGVGTNSISAASGSAIYANAGNVTVTGAVDTISGSSNGIMTEKGSITLSAAVDSVTGTNGYGMMAKTGISVPGTVKEIRGSVGLFTMEGGITLGEVGFVEGTAGSGVYAKAGDVTLQGKTAVTGMTHGIFAENGGISIEKEVAAYSVNSITGTALADAATLRLPSSASKGNISGGTLYIGTKGYIWVAADDCYRCLNDAHTSVSSSPLCSDCGKHIAVAQVTTAEDVTTYYTSLIPALEKAGASPKSTLKLLKSVSGLTEMIKLTAGEYTIDLNGCTLDSSASYIFQVGGATVTVTDTATGGAINRRIHVGAGKLIVAGGKITSNQNYTVLVDNKGALEITGGEVSTTAESSDAIGLSGKVSLLVTGGEIVGTEAGVLANLGGTVTVTGGKISGGNYGIYTQQDVNTAISGGEISATGTNGGALICQNGTVTVTGGTFRGAYTVKNYDGQVTVSGGYYPEGVATSGDGVTLKSILKAGYGFADAEGLPVELESKSQPGARTVKLLLPEFTLDGDTYYYLGQPVEPELTAPAGVTEGQDYEITYADNTAGGTGTVTVTGKGRYVGRQTFTFTIEDVQAVIDAIDELPETAQPDDTDVIDQLLDVVQMGNELSDEGRKRISNMDKLQDVFKQLTDYRVILGDGGKYTKGSGKTLSFTANGPAFGREVYFAALFVDGDYVEPENYTVASGSTIAELKSAYLETLEVGEHTVMFVYTFLDRDFETNEATFRVVEKSVRPGGNSGNTNPDTGDLADMTLWLGMVAVSTLGLASLLLLKKKIAK